MHVDVIGPHVAEGHYDLIGPNNEIILPGVWDTVIEPDWTITMHMWPMPEKEETLEIIDVPLLPDLLVGEKKKRKLEFHGALDIVDIVPAKKATKKAGGWFFGGPPAKAKSKPKPGGSAAAAAAALAKK